MLVRIYHFLKTDLWRMQPRDLAGGKSVLLRPLRILLLAFRGFLDDNCQLRASALTFYSLLSVVPVAAMGFGIAKGFGLEQNLQQLLVEKLEGQEEVLQWIIQFAGALLANTKGGVIAGVGVLLLFWAVINLLNNIEKALNDIWYLKKGRSFARRLSNYLSLMLICPVLLIASSSLTVFITSQMTVITEKISVLGTISPLIFFLLKLSPFVVAWVLFTFLFIVIPNTDVSIKSGLSAGILTGTVFQIVQKAYIYFQIGVANYNAIYGSFAALPLFLMWLQLSWLVVLFGAEVSFAVDNEEEYGPEPEVEKPSPHFQRLLALRVTALCVRRFCDGEPPADAAAISHALGSPIRLVQQALSDLVEARVLSLVKHEDQTKRYYQPAQDPGNLTIKRVSALLDKNGSDNIPLTQDREFEKLCLKLESLEQLSASSPDNVSLKDL
jgi:membrane protein